MARCGALAGAIALLALPAAAQTVSDHAGAVALTLYRGDSLPTGISRFTDGQGLALVTEARTVELPAGPATLAFRGVADTLVPQSAQVDGLPGPVAESDFDYDLLSPASLVARSVGATVRLVRVEPKTGKPVDQSAVIRSGPDGVVLDEGGGKVEALGCSGLPERLVFDHTPRGLSDRPTLSVRTIAPRAGRYRLTLSYLATDFDWSADYVARIDPDGRTLDLSGWLTLKNASATGFAQAPTQVVAGRLARTGDDRAITPVSRTLDPACWPAERWSELMKGRGRRFRRLIDALAPPPPPPPPPPAPMAARLADIVVTASAKQSELGDYKLYTLPAPTTVAAHETKQVLFLSQARVPFERVYAYAIPFLFAPAATEDPETRITLRLRNTEGGGLGKPLPSGRVVAMAPGTLGELFAGADRIADTPVALPLEIALGRSSQVQAAARLISLETNADGMPRRERVEVVATNATVTAATVEFRQAMRPGLKVTTEDRPHDLKDGAPRWTVILPPGGRAVLHYGLELPG